MDFNSALSSLILLMNIQGFLTVEYIFTQVNCEHKNICALKETNVTLKCFHSNINITTGFWFSQKQRTNWREKDEPEDLTLDLDYSGRVNQLITNSQSQLIISDLRERDSGEYQLMFIMKDGVKHLSSVTVNLTVTVLQVRASRITQRVKLTCETSCNLTSSPQHFYWKKDGQYLQSITGKLFWPEVYGAYSCFLTPDLKNASAPVCLSNSNCWNVIYASRRVCALVGSTVDINSTYLHPTGYTVEKTYWHFIHPGEFRDLREKQQFAGRVEYLGNTLRIKDVKMSDSGEYRFRIITDRNSYSGSPGVILAVTDTEVKSSPATASDGEKVILSCSPKCNLDNNITFSWYKNGRPATDGFKLSNKLYLDSVNKEEIQDYSCRVGDNHHINQDLGQERNKATRITIVIISVLLFLSVIGVLSYRFLRRQKRKCISSQNCDDAKEVVQPEPSTVDNTIPLSRISDLKCQTESKQNLHYSSIYFKHSHKDTSPMTTVIYSSAEDVQYATVKLK